MAPAADLRCISGDADEPGRWAYHCHLLYHMETGMFRAVHVA
jgi:FtsP/CotA-like multicopper oxidase with cupredoxin domain